MERPGSPFPKSQISLLYAKKYILKMEHIILMKGEKYYEETNACIKKEWRRSYI